jgi:hypothetical protein
VTVTVTGIGIGTGIGMGWSMISRKSRLKMRVREKVPEQNRNEHEEGVDGIPPSRQWTMRRSLRPGDPVISDATLRTRDERSNRGNETSHSPMGGPRS